MRLGNQRKDIGFWALGTQGLRECRREGRVGEPGGLGGRGGERGLGSGN